MTRDERAGRPVERAQRILAEDMDPVLHEHLTRLVESGQALWREDPWVPNVAAVVWADRPNVALVVVYTDGDWEVSDEMEASL